MLPEKTFFFLLFIPRRPPQAPPPPPLYHARVIVVYAFARRYISSSHSLAIPTYISYELYTHNIIYYTRAHRIIRTHTHRPCSPIHERIIATALFLFFFPPLQPERCCDAVIAVVIILLYLRLLYERVYARVSAARTHVRVINTAGLLAL